jgi:hypothetical protein
MNLVVTLVNGDRGRELIRVRIEGIPLGFGLFSDEYGERNTGVLRRSPRLDRTVKRLG